MLGCDIRTHAPAQQSYTNFAMYPFVIKHAIQTLLGMGMGMNVTAY